MRELIIHDRLLGRIPGDEVKTAAPRLHVITRRVLSAFSGDAELTNSALASALGTSNKEARLLAIRYSARGLLTTTGEVRSREKVRRITPSGAALLVARRRKRPPTKAQREGRAAPVANSIFSPNMVGLNMINFKRTV